MLTKIFSILRECLVRPGRLLHSTAAQHALSKSLRDTPRLPKFWRSTTCWAAWGRSSKRILKINFAELLSKYKPYTNVLKVSNENDRFLKTIVIRFLTVQNEWVIFIKDSFCFENDLQPYLYNLQHI